MTATITFHPDDEARLALAILTADGPSVSRVVSDALVQASARHAKACLCAEADALAADVDGRSEASEVLRDMAVDSLSTQRSTRRSRT